MFRLARSLSGDVRRTTFKRGFQTSTCSMAIYEVGPKQAMSQLKSKYFDHILDVREMEEYHQVGTIPGAKLVPLGLLPSTSFSLE